MTVYVLMRNVPYESGQCYGVFSSRVKAELGRLQLLASKQARDHHIYSSELEVEEHNLDELL